MRCCSFKYPVSGNIGDEIQSLAAEQFLPRVDERLDRDALNKITGGEERLVIMNGWFTKFAQNWPPAPSVVPVFFGFHLTPLPSVVQSFLRPESIAYFRRIAPIGCRDRATQDLLQQAGVETFYSKCLTLTFPRRKVAPTDGRVFLVDVPDSFRPKIPKSLAQGAIVVSHQVQDVYGEDVKFAIARRLLTLYEQQAKLVITTRLHCALPCLAMGIPVVFVGNPDEARISLLADLGVTIHPFSADSAEVDWIPPLVDLEDEKSRMTGILQDRLNPHPRANNRQRHGN